MANNYDIKYRGNDGVVRWNSMESHPTTETLSGDITVDTTLTADKILPILFLSTGRQVSIVNVIFFKSSLLLNASRLLNTSNAASADGFLRS